MAQRKPNGTVRPSANGETIGGLTSRVAVEFVCDA